MSALPIVITTAGLQALINAQNTGVSNVVIATLGVSPNHVAITAATTAIPGELKRLGGVAGMVTAEDTIYVSAADQTQDTYSVRTVALYLTDGTLFAAYSQTAPLVEKAGPSQAVLEASVKFTAPLAEVVQFEGGGWVNPPASETVAGVLRLATVDEAIAGVSHSKAVTPKGLKAVTSAMMAAIQATLDQITQALAGKANTAHQHGAGDVVAGVFNEARIPELPMSRIGGLIATLTDKAQALHSHTMAQVSGLIDALAAKANLAGAIFTGAVRVRSSSSQGAVELNSGGATRPGLVAFFTPDSVRRGYVGYASSDEGGELVLQGETGWIWRFSHRPRFGASTPWDTGNFNPDAKATLGDQVRFSAVSFGLGRGHIYGDGDRLVARVGSQGAERNFGFNTNGDFQAYNGNVLSQHGRVWDPGNFNPADKAPALHSHDWAQVTGKPNLATTDGSGVNFGSWSLGLAVQVNGSDWRYLPTAQHVDTIIDWRVATNAETLAGALTHKFVSPAALWSFTRSIGPNGYQQIPGTDLIIQWGVSNGSHPEGAVHAVLPVAFGGGCLFACATPRNAGQAYGMDFVMQIVGRYLDRIVFYANRANSSSGNMSGYEWMAVGLARGNPDPVYSSGYPPGGGGGGGGGEIIP